MLKRVFLLIHVLAVFLQLPAINAIEFAIEIDHTRKTVGIAPCTEVGFLDIIGSTFPYPSIFASVAGECLVCGISYNPHTSEIIQVESLEMIGFLVHPITNSERSCGITYPFVLTKVYLEVFLRPCGSGLPLNGGHDTFFKIVSVAVIYLHPSFQDLAVLRQVVDSRDIDISTFGLRDVDLSTVAPIGDNLAEAQVGDSFLKSRLGTTIESHEKKD